MEKYNVTKSAQSALRNNAAFEPAALSARSLQKRALAQSNFGPNLARNGMKCDELAQSAITVQEDVERNRVSRKPNSTLVYQGAIVAKFATFARALAVMLQW